MSNLNSPSAPDADWPARTVPCPHCGGQSVYAPTNPYRPFCSTRCRQMDLGLWASDQFRVAAAPPDPDEAADWPATPG